LSNTVSKVCSQILTALVGRHTSFQKKYFSLSLARVPTGMGPSLFVRRKEPVLQTACSTRRGMLHDGTECYRRKSFSDAASAAARSTRVRRSRQSFTSLI